MTREDSSGVRALRGDLIAGRGRRRLVGEQSVSQAVIAPFQAPITRRAELGETDRRSEICVRWSWASVQHSGKSVVTVAAADTRDADMMHLTHQQEEFSRAFIYAISAAAGLKFSHAATPDDDSVDVAISARGPRGTTRSPRLEIQCKCQMSAAAGDPIPYPLKPKNYEDLRHSDYRTPRILVVVFVPEQIKDWTTHTEQEFTMRYCAYWASLCGLPPSSNQYSTTVHLPRTHVFNVAGLDALMDRIGRGETP